MKKHSFYICLLAIISISACTNKMKPASIENAPAETKQVVDEGKVIQPSFVGEIDTVKKSLKAVAHGMIGNAHVKVLYHSPAVRGRVIWGGLVPFNQVWATGAHMATAIEVDKEFIVGDKKLEAGKYALFTFPGKEEWIVVINKNWEQHLTDEYDAKDDLVRLSIKPEMVNSLQERLMYQINSSKSQVEFRWENLRLLIPVRATN